MIEIFILQYKQFRVFSIFILFHLSFSFLTYIFILLDNKFFCFCGFSDLGDWLGVEENGLFNFKPSVRPVPLEVHIQASTIPHFLIIYMELQEIFM